MKLEGGKQQKLRLKHFDTILWKLSAEKCMRTFLCFVTKKMLHKT